MRNEAKRFGTVYLVIKINVAWMKELQLWDEGAGTENFENICKAIEAQVKSTKHPYSVTYDASVMDNCKIKLYPTRNSEGKS